MIFRINQTVFDSEAKEYVIISNGYPVDEETHYFTGAIIPTEAIAYRLIELKPNGKPVIAFTYRKVKAENLSTGASEACFANANHDHCASNHYEFIGRI